MTTASDLSLDSASLSVSVIIPVYNGERYIQNAIESVLEQRNCQFELIVIDDGSSDGTARAIQPYQQHLRYIYQENRGVSAARNLGIEQAQGKYVAFLDADDYFLPDKLAFQQEVFLEGIKTDSHRVPSAPSPGSPPVLSHLSPGLPVLGMVHSGWQRVDADKTILSEVRPWEECPMLDLVTWLVHKPVLPSAMMFHRQWLQQVGGFDLQLAAAEDVDLVLRLAIAGCQSKWLPQVTTAYRQHGNSAMGNGLMQAKCLSILLDKTFSHPQLPPEAQLLETKVRKDTLIWAAWYLYQTDNLSAMAQVLRQAYQLAPKPATTAIVEWVDSFEAFSQGVDEPLDSNKLTQSKDWQSLIQVILASPVEAL